jgi:hypothetical protein
VQLDCECFAMGRRCDHDERLARANPVRKEIGDSARQVRFGPIELDIMPNIPRASAANSLGSLVESLNQMEMHVYL